MRYSLREVNGELALKSIDQSGNVTYIDGSRERTELINSLIKEGAYVVKRYSNSIVLSHKGVSLRIENFNETLNNVALISLKEDVQSTIKTRGYIDKVAAQKVEHKPNRKRSNAIWGKVALMGSAATLMALIAGNSLVNLAQQRAQTNGTVTEIEAGVLESANVVEKKAIFDEILVTSQPEATPTVEQRETSSENESPVEEIDVAPQQDAIPTGYLECANNYNADKAIYARETYGDLMSKYARLYGLDEELLLAIGTQERGVHSTEKDAGGGLGLMQIQYSVWIGKTLTVQKLNEATGEFEPYTIHVTDEYLKSLEGNIEMGAAVLQTCLKYAKYNIPVAIQMYNQGSGSLEAIISQYCQATGKDYASVIADPEDLGWIPYCQAKAGDPNYLANVNQWAEDRAFTVINVKTYEEISYRFDNTKKI